MKACKVALVQIDSQADQKENKRKITEAVERASEEKAGLIIFPETVEYIGDDFRGNASEIPGELESFFSELARKHGVWLHAGSITEKHGDKLCNLTLLFAPDGKRCAAYRKIHLFDVDVADGPSYKESSDITPGDSLVVADTEFGRLGLSICYDLRFPQMFAKMADLGAQVLIVSANFTDATGRDHWEPLLRARAIENTCYVLACGQCGGKKAFKAHGHSMIIDPWGRILAQAGEEETILYGELDPKLLETCRRQIPCLQNRRRDIY